MCKAFSTIATALALLSIVTGVERTFYDTPQTFARYPAWDMTETGVLRFKFQTIKQNSLLLYFDGADSSQDFVKVQIVNGKIVCQTNFGSGKRSVDIGYALADGNWHTLQLSFRRGVLDVILDDSRNKELNLPSSDENEDNNILNVKSPIFIGGVKSNTPNLVQPYVPVEPQFAGCIKDFEFTRFDGSMGQPLVKEEHGTKEGCASSACDDQNILSSCKNGGSCIAQSDGYFCDCNVTGYTGDKCTIAATSATFRASEYIVYQAEQSLSPTKFDSLTFRVKTSRSNGLILYYEEDNFFMSVEVIKSTLCLNIGSGKVQQILSLDALIGDNQWHEVIIGRYEAEVTLKMDEEQKSTKLAEPRPVHYNKKVYVGGADNLLKFQGVRSKLNFVGCLQQLVFNKKQMLRSAKLSMQNYQVHGDLKFMCTEVSNVPVMFNTPNAFLELDPWQISRDLALQFKTTNKDGVIVFNGNEQRYLTLELREGQIVFSALKDGKLYEIVVGEELADSQWHILTARHDINGIYIFVDSSGESKKLYDTPGEMIFSSTLLLGKGGAGAPSLRPSYLGCMQGFSVAHEVVDLYALLADIPPGVVAGCSSLAEACAIQPCYHGSSCIQKLNSFQCDCTGTGYEGSLCLKESMILTFSGSQFLRYSSFSPITADVDKISFRFRTLAEKGIVMFVTSDKWNNKYLYFEIMGGKLYMFFQFGTASRFQQIGDLVNNGNWHVVKYVRDRNRISLKLDDQEVRHDIEGSQVQFEYKYAYIGGAPPDEWRSVSRMTKSKAYFDGCVQQATLNGVQLISADGGGMIMTTARPGCKYQETNEQQVAAFVRPSYISLPPWLFNDDEAQLTFHFRTKERNALVIFHGSYDADFLAIELKNGRLICHLYIGETGKSMSSLVSNLNDNVWHNVSLRQQKSSVDFEVDSTPVTQRIAEGEISAEFMFKGPLFVGGTPEGISVLPDMIKSTPPLIGCVRALSVNRMVQDVLQAGHDKSGVKAECEGSCASYPCLNNGHCTQLEDNYDCICEGTFYKGNTCDQEMTPVRFSPGSSLTYTLSAYDPTTTVSDNIHIKYKTDNSYSQLVQIETIDPNQYITILIDDGFLKLTVGMAGQQISLKSPTKISDDKIHSLHFKRKHAEIEYSFDNEAGNTSLSASGALEFGQITRILLGGRYRNYHFSGCFLAMEYNKITPFENLDSASIKSVGLSPGSCEAKHNPTVKPNTPNNNVDKITKAKTDNDSNIVEPTMGGNTRRSSGLSLPFIIIIAIGAFLCILVLTYGISRFARRKQGEYKTNEEKRMGDIEYDKLSLRVTDAYEVPTPKRELYM